MEALRFELCGFDGMFYARSCILTSENFPSTTSVNKGNKIKKKGKKRKAGAPQDPDPPQFAVAAEHFPALY